VSEKPEDAPGDETSLSGKAARRKFLRSSGRVAMAAPAAVLLLSATRAHAQTSYTIDQGPDDD
jgi:hypothetical protein